MEKELRSLLENVPGSYDDFVTCVMDWVQEKEGGDEKVYNFIADNPEAKPDEVLAYLFDEVLD